MANGVHGVEGQNLRKAGGDDAADNHSEESSWYHISTEEAQGVASSSPKPHRATNGMAIRPGISIRQPQFPSFHWMGRITPRQPKYSEKRDARSGSRLDHTRLLLPEINVEQNGGYMNHVATKFSEPHRDEPRTPQARAAAHGANVANSKQ
jgi:hypothetical protein